MLVYMAGKYTSKTQKEKLENIKKAEEVAKQLLLKGLIPVIPHKITCDFELDEGFLHWSADDWLERFCFPLLEKCDAMIVSCGLDTSYGVKKEIEFANSRNISVFFDVNDIDKIKELK